MKNSIFKKIIKEKKIIGWKEWCELPELDIPLIKAKIDTGARTSALHAFNIQPFKKGNKHFVYFEIHPLQRNNEIVKCCEAAVIDERSITSSNGHKERRYVISTLIRMNDKQWDIELTLSNRDPLIFRMLLGRNALAGHVIIDPNAVFRQGKIKKNKVRRLY